MALQSHLLITAFIELFIFIHFTYLYNYLIIIPKLAAKFFFFCFCIILSLGITYIIIHQLDKSVFFTKDFLMLLNYT